MSTSLSVNTISLSDSDDEEVALRLEAKKQRQEAADALARAHAEEEAREEAERQAQKVARDKRRQEEQLRHEEEERKKREEERLEEEKRLHKEGKKPEQGDPQLEVTSQCQPVGTPSRRGSRKRRCAAPDFEAKGMKMGGPNACMRCIQNGVTCVAQTQGNSTACVRCHTSKYKCQAPRLVSFDDDEEDEDFISAEADRRSKKPVRKTQTSILLETLNSLQDRFDHHHRETRAHQSRIEEWLERMCLGQEKLMGIMTNNEGGSSPPSISELCLEATTRDVEDGMEGVEDDRNSQAPSAFSTGGPPVS